MEPKFSTKIWVIFCILMWSKDLFGGFWKLYSNSLKTAIPVPALFINWPPSRHLKSIKPNPLQGWPGENYWVAEASFKLGISYLIINPMIVRLASGVDCRYHPSIKLNWIQEFARGLIRLSWSFWCQEGETKKLGGKSLSCCYAVPPSSLISPLLLMIDSHLQNTKTYYQQPSHFYEYYEWEQPYKSIFLSKEGKPNRELKVEINNWWLNDRLLIFKWVLLI